MSKKRKAVIFGDSKDEDSEEESQGKKHLSVLWHVRTYHGRVHYVKDTGQASKAEKEQTF